MTEVRLERRIEHPIDTVWNAIATPDGHVVDPRATAQGSLLRGGDQDLALVGRLQEGDVEACGDRPYAAGVAGQREGAVGQGEDEAAMADRVSIEHVAAHGHRELRASGRHG